MFSSTRSGSVDGVSVCVRARRLFLKSCIAACVVDASCCEISGRGHKGGRMVLRGAALSIWKPPTERPRDVDGTIRLVDGAGWSKELHQVATPCGWWLWWLVCGGWSGTSVAPIAKNDHRISDLRFLKDGHTDTQS